MEEEKSVKRIERKLLVTLYHIKGHEKKTIIRETDIQTNSI